MIERLKNDKIKPLHHYISNQVVVDLWVYHFMSKVYEKVFDIPLTMFSKFISEQLSTETDFVHEMENAQKLQTLINNDPELRNMNLKRNIGSFEVDYLFHHE